VSRCRVSFTVEREPLGVILKRGLRRRCPRCGEGPLFRRGINTYDRCSVCDLVYQPDRGDTWFFMIITDRLPIFAGIIAVYFGFHPQTWPAISAFFAAVALPVVATIRERQGLALALDYFVRTRTEASSV